MPLLSCFKLYTIQSQKGFPQTLSPPFPVFVGSPPWIINPLMFLWKIVLLYYPIAARARKFLHVLGASQQNNQILIMPCVVFRETDIVCFTNQVYYNQLDINIQFNNNWEMGNEATTIDTLQIPIQQLKSKTPIQQTKYCPPFRKFGSQSIKIEGQSIEVLVSIQQPNSQAISIKQNIYSDLEDAFDYRTKNIQLTSVVTDQLYTDVRTYMGYDDGKDVALQLKSFSHFNSYAFNNFIYEMHMNQQIEKLKCKNLNTIQQKYVIETGLEVQGQENPKTQVYVLSPVVTNLSQIIKYRRENKWPWSTSQFNALAKDLTQALLVLHNNRISHNDIRPCNVFYSLQKNCYQLACFANSVANASSQPRKSMGMSQMRTSIHYEAPQLRTSANANLFQADIYSMGITLLSAFYLCEPLDYTMALQKNKRYLSSYPALNAIHQMVMPIQKRTNLNTILQLIPPGEHSKKMKNLIQSLKYKNTPKQQQLVTTKKLISEGYQRLGLWNQWKDKLYQAYQLQQNSIDEYHKANSLIELAKIQHCRGDFYSAQSYSKQASTLYRALGYVAYDQGNLNQSLNFFSRAIQCSKYFESRSDMDAAKNLQGLALIHAEKGEYQISKPLISEASSIVVKNEGTNSIQYCKIRMSEAKIQSDFGQFQIADKILTECLALNANLMKQNEQAGMKSKAQILHQLGRNAMLQSSYSQNNKQVYITKAERYLSQSVVINEKIPDNQLQLANNYETLGEIQLRKQNYIGARSNFKKSEQLRASSSNNKNSIPIARQKQRAQALCNIAACQSGMGNNNQALQNYNQAISIYRGLFGSDHNNFSAIAIGNMSKVYFKLGQNAKAKDCIALACQILSDLLGDDDPDYLHFKYLQETF